jgi:hypothetical protein
MISQTVGSTRSVSKRSWHLNPIEDDDLGGIVGVTQVAADPEQAGPWRQVQQHLQAVVGRLFGFAVAQFAVGDDDLLVLEYLLAAQVELLDVEGARRIRGQTENYRLKNGKNRSNGEWL